MIGTRRRRILVAATLVGAWALLAVSCGARTVTHEEYGRDLREAMADVEEAYGDTGDAVAPAKDTAEATTGQTIDDLRTTQLALRDAGNRLDAIAAPTDLQDDHDALVAGVRDMADDIDLLVRAQQLAESDPAEAKRLAREFATSGSFGAVEAAASRIEKAGVDAGL